MNNKCIICGGLKTKVVFKEFDIDILKCPNCGHVFSSYRINPDFEEFFGRSVMSDENFWWNETHKRMYADFCNRYINGKSGRLLDVGSGLGYFVKTMASFPNWETFGYDISEVGVEFARNKLGLDNVFCGKIEEAGFPENHFDIITLWDVLEHIPDPDPLLSYLSSILKDNGILFIHTPNIHVQLPKARLKKLFKGMKQGVSYLEATTHINIYSMDTIKKLFSRNGFNKVEFVHLYPLQSMNGSKSPLLRSIKNSWFYFSKILFISTFGKINIDNLFVVAVKN